MVCPPLFPVSPPLAPLALVESSGGESDRRTVGPDKITASWMREGSGPTPRRPPLPKWRRAAASGRDEHVFGRSQDGASCNGWHVPRPQAVSFAGSCGHLQSNQGRPMLDCLFQPYAAPIPSHSLLGIVQQFATPTPPDNKGPGIPCALFNL